MAQWPRHDRGGYLLMQIDRHDQVTEREEPDKKLIEILTILSRAAFLGSPQKTHLPYAFFYLEPKILQGSG